MRHQFIRFADRLYTSYWFLPALMTACGAGLSFLTVCVDRMLADTLTGVRWLYAGGPEGARAVLQAVAGSMITVAGVTFSVTMVALSLASSQLGPKLLDNFMRDTGNKAVLGTFVSTFLYCLLVLRTIRSLGNETFVPSISVSAAILLAVASIGVLIYFFQHVSDSIHAEEVVASVGRDLARAIDRIFPGRRTPGMFESVLRSEEDLPPRLEEEAQPVQDPRSGYLQTVDYDALFQTAEQEDLILSVDFRPGDFVAPEKDIVRVWPGGNLDDKLTERINGTLTLGVHPSWKQDVVYAINQLVAIAVRALSPGINDPFLAMACIDQLGAALITLAQKHIPPSYLYDLGGRLRLVTSPFTFANALDAAFHQIRQNSTPQVTVTLHLLETIAAIAGVVRNEDQRRAIRRHADMIRRASDRRIEEQLDREAVEERYRSLIAALETDGKAGGEH